MVVRDLGSLSVPLKLPSSSDGEPGDDKMTMAQEFTLSVSRIVAVATVEVAAQAEASVLYVNQTSQRVAALVGAFDRSTDTIRKNRPNDSRSARLCSRRAQLVADQVDKVVEAARLAREASRQVGALGEATSPQVEDVRWHLEQAIKAAARAERGARIARGYLWETVNLALEAARNRDLADVAVELDRSMESP